jgi:hypothetical protein
MATVKKPIKKAASGSKLPKAQTGYPKTKQRGTDAFGNPHPIVEHIGRKPAVKKKSKPLPKGTLTQAELDALSHQKRGMGQVDNTFVKKSGSIMNDLGTLTNSQVEQLKKYMNKASAAKSFYEGLPNVGRMLGHGNSAADIPKGSQLENQRNGGKVVRKKAKSGATIAKAKDGKWMQKAAASIKKRGTAGKCTPITKPGCTGKAKALAKTFKKIAKSNKKK